MVESRSTMVSGTYATASPPATVSITMADTSRPGESRTMESGTIRSARVAVAMPPRDPLSPTASTPSGR